MRFFQPWPGHTPGLVEVNDDNLSLATVSVVTNPLVSLPIAGVPAISVGLSRHQRRPFPHFGMSGTPFAPRRLLAVIRAPHPGPLRHIHAKNAMFFAEVTS